MKNMIEVVTYRIDSNNSRDDVWGLIRDYKVIFNPSAIVAIVVDKATWWNMPLDKVDGEQSCIILMCSGQKLIVSRSGVSKIQEMLCEIDNSQQLADLHCVNDITLYNEDGEQTYCGRFGFINKNHISTIAGGLCVMKNNQKIWCKKVDEQW